MSKMHFTSEDALCPLIGIVNSVLALQTVDTLSSSPFVNLISQSSRASLSSRFYFLLRILNAGAAGIRHGSDIFTLLRL